MDKEIEVKENLIDDSIAIKNELNELKLTLNSLIETLHNHFRGEFSTMFLNLKK